MSGLCNALTQASTSDAKVAVLTGNGPYYSSGNDLTNFVSSEPQAIVAERAVKVRHAQSSDQMLASSRRQFFLLSMKYHLLQTDF
jgi:enoyl-CoA hydratase/carnithine racemase